MAGGWYKEDLDQLDPNTALHIHLTSRLFPPREIMFDVAKRALVKARKGRWDDRLRLPVGVSHRVHGNLVPVSEIVRHLHLDDLL